MLKPARMAILLPLLLVACSEKFPLYAAIDVPGGIAAKQQQKDILQCKDEAQGQASKSGDQIKALFQGAAALEDNRNLQRKIFAECMSAKGYTVVPVQATKTDAAQQTSPGQAKHS